MIVLFLLSFNLASSAHLKSKIRAGTLSESDAITLMKKYQPVVYFHEKEGYFPTAIESFKIDWTKATFGSASAVYDTNGYKGETSLKQDAPLYVSILENTDGTIRISYLFIFGWNDSGSSCNFKAKAAGIGVDKTFVAGDYGLDLHYSDVEHIEVYLKSDMSTVSSLVYAYHQWTEEYSSSEVTWEGTHPVVYSAKGSHASYPKGGEVTYHSVWSESKSKLGVKLYDTYFKLIDYCANSTKLKWDSTNPRLLKLNGSATTDISADEHNLAFKYSGRLGTKYDNVKWDDFKDKIRYNDFMTILKKISQSTYNSISSKMSEVEKLMEAGASKGFYTRSFW